MQPTVFALKKHLAANNRNLVFYESVYTHARS